MIFLVDVVPIMEKIAYLNRFFVISPAYCIVSLLKRTARFKTRLSKLYVYVKFFFLQEYSSR